MARWPHQAGIYVHFPYCLRKCPYCDFASEAAAAEAIPQRAYAQAVITEARLRALALRERCTFTSLYIGGGTPSLWRPDQVGAVIEGVVEAFGAGGEMTEVTLECNPSSLDGPRAAAYARAGVTRLSVGVQSGSDDDLRFLRRLHDGLGAREAIEAASRAVERVSVDLMIGLPGQRPEDAATQAVGLVRSGVGHISSYLLTIEANTPFAEERAAGRLPAIDDAEAAEAYVAVSDALTAEGFEHYEVSSFARGQQRSLHNTTVWGGGSYVGLGAGAVGMVGLSAGRYVRYANRPDPTGYVEGVAALGAVTWEGDDRLTSAVEVLDGRTRATERILMGLRVAEGVDFEEVGMELGVRLWTERRRRRAQELWERGRVELSGSRVRIARRQWLWASDTTARLI